MAAPGWLDWLMGFLWLGIWFYAVWDLGTALVRSVSERVLKFQQRKRFRQVGMDWVLADLLAGNIPRRQVTAVIEHWRQPSTVAQWEKWRVFEIRRGDFSYRTRSSLPGRGLACSRGTD